MTFSAMYMGMSPFEAPATYTLLQYAEYAKGVFYPVGGFQTLVAAFEKVARGFGAEFIYDTSVKRIIVEGESEDDESVDEGKVSEILGASSQAKPAVGKPLSSSSSRVKGIELESGEKIYADAVVSNADLIWTVSV
jgi:phytoene desaturase (3,4-didehydrolycopene-forming)